MLADNKLENGYIFYYQRQLTRLKRVKYDHLMVAQVKFWSNYDKLLSHLRSQVEFEYYDGSWQDDFP